MVRSVREIISRAGGLGSEIGNVAGQSMKLGAGYFTKLFARS
jgi:hypothetical protein